ncbi:homeobox-domain-containing protein [Obba rivulosa]|uniref:Homeobox-domain-containing protein n=1 Tax=Obba rivulosa TaxID=1052685 RepID=A0A8E2J5A9_9APHY|nr:homeobox-domain-containing protein [Obba rivulosa]
MRYLPSSSTADICSNSLVDAQGVHDEASDSLARATGETCDGRRKRSRVMPEQLAYLEDTFAATEHPTAPERRRIGVRLNMSERQVQVWFQNRRAKAKFLNIRKTAPARLVEPPPESPPPLSTGFDLELCALLHEDEPVTIISCTNLSIGTWQRVSSASGKHDLVTYLCEKQRRLAWFVQSFHNHLKMEVPFDSINDANFSNISPGVGMAVFSLSQPPLFYVDAPSPDNFPGSLIRCWRRCGDWTEGMQATQVLRHELVGSAAQLAHIIETVNSNRTADILLLSPRSGTPALSPPHEHVSAHGRQ